MGLGDAGVVGEMTHQHVAVEPLEALDPRPAERAERLGGGSLDLALDDDGLPRAVGVLRDPADGERALEVVAREGPDHAPSFVAEVVIEGLPPGRGEGRSKRVAEQAAATHVLVREGIWDAAPDG